MSYWMRIGMYLSMKCSIVFILLSYSSSDLFTVSNCPWICIFCSWKFDLSCLVSFNLSTLTLKTSSLFECSLVRSLSISLILLVESTLSCNFSNCSSILPYRVTISLNILFRSVWDCVNLLCISLTIVWMVSLVVAMESLLVSSYFWKPSTALWWLVIYKFMSSTVRLNASS